MKKVRLRNQRPKAFLGIGETGAILAAAGIQAAATAASAATGAKATAAAAKQQAQSMVASAKTNAEALKQQNENNNNLQQQSIDFTREQNAQNRQLQQDIAMNLQMLAGKESMADRQEASKINVAAFGYGTKNKAAKLRDIAMGFSLKGSNMPFAITDGGNVIYIGRTRKGEDLYEFVGDDHHHYHRISGGKYKSGIGVKFANGETVEAEGNGNGKYKTYGGEILKVGPNSAEIYSKHDFLGIGQSPADMIKNGEDPDMVFAMQEQGKQMLGIDSEGKTTKKNYTSPVDSMYGRAAFGLGISPYTPIDNNYFDYVTVPATVGYAVANNRPRLRNGGRVKAVVGWKNPWMTSYTIGYDDERPAVNNFGYYSSTDKPATIVTSKPAGTTVNKPNLPDNLTGAKVTSSTGAKGWLNNNWASLAGAGITSFGNILGGIFSSRGNSQAAKYMAQGRQDAFNAGAEYLNQMHGIDTSLLNKDMFDVGQAMATVRSAAGSYNINPQLEAARRYARNQQQAIKNTTGSSAAIQHRINAVQDAAQQQASNLYATKYNKEEQVKQENAQQINYMANENANRQIQANNNLTGAMLNLLQYNADVDNTKYQALADLKSNTILGQAQDLAQAKQLNAQTWNQAINSVGGNFGNVFSDYADMNRQLYLSSMYNDPSTQLDWYIRRGDKKAAQNWINTYGGSEIYKDQVARAKNYFGIR